MKSLGDILSSSLERIACKIFTPVMVIISFWAVGGVYAMVPDGWKDFARYALPFLMLSLWVTREQNYTTIPTDTLRKMEWTCAHCDEISNLKIFHRIPKSQGGTDDIENLIPLCERHYEEMCRHYIDSGCNYK